MWIGVPKEIKNNEFRVALTPAGANILTKAGHHVLMQKGAGIGSGISDEEYLKAGAELLETPEEIYAKSGMIMKVKEPQPSEYALIRVGQILFTYLHLASDILLTEALLDSDCIAIAYETIQLEDGSLPVLAPMSEAAGRLATQMGAYYLTKTHGGRGILLGGLPGVERSKVTIIGAGVVGGNAAKIAIGMGAQVFLLDVNRQRLAQIDDMWGNTVNTLISNSEEIERLVTSSDLVIGSVLIPGAKAPWLVTREMVNAMKEGSVIVDVSIDQGGCFETSRPTTHQDPVYSVHDVIHYCVTNMPSMVARNSTFALTGVTLPYALLIANKGLRGALEDCAPLRTGVNIYRGKVTCQGVSQVMGCQCEHLMTCMDNDSG
jgi:alanine dehydrogenase